MLDSTSVSILEFPSFNIVLEEQVAVGLYYILTVSCSSQTNAVTSYWIWSVSPDFLNLQIWVLLSEYSFVCRVMYCKCCLHKYHSYITFTDVTLTNKPLNTNVSICLSYLVASTIVLYYIMARADPANYDGFNLSINPGILFIVLEEQVAVGLYCILTGSCSSQTKSLYLCTVDIV